MSEKIGPFKITMNLEVRVTESRGTIAVEGCHQRRRFDGLSKSPDWVDAGVP